MINPIKRFNGGGTEAEHALPGDAAVLRAADSVLKGHKRGLRSTLPFLGPAFIAAVAYIDPGNFATNISGGAKFGYKLLWVILAANLMAMLIQTLSAKLGVVTGKNLPELCRDNFSKRTSIGLWIQAEFIAMATDLAEFIGAALALNLLFGVPLFTAGLITAIGAFAILELQRRGFRRLEAVIAGMVGMVVLAFATEIFFAKPDWGQAAKHAVVPGFDGSESILLATGILGATVMPHVIYLHSALMQGRVVGRNDQEKRKILRFMKIDVIFAMGLAGLVNMAMLVMAAALFFKSGLTSVETIEDAYSHLKTLVPVGGAAIFGVALLVSGLSSSSVGTLSGQVVMQGFINRRIPIFLRRAITMTPALIVLAIGLNPTYSLVMSQVVLSFGIPFALVPMLWLTSSRSIMGGFVNHRLTTVAASVIAALIIALNVFLLWETLVA